MRRIGLSLTGVASCLVLAVVCVIVSAPPMAVAKNPDKGGGRKAATAEVTITGPMETLGTQTFPIKESKRTLTLNRHVSTDDGAVPISFNFEDTVTTEGNCEEIRGESLILRAHLNDSVEGLIAFPLRWGVTIVIDKSSLGGVDNPSFTNFKGGHSIDITTHPDQTDTDTITGGTERLWIPEGPSKSGPVTVTWIEDTTDSVAGTRTRVFEFSAFKIQVWTDTRGNVDKVMRCDNLDGPITVTVVTEL